MAIGLKLPQGILLAAERRVIGMNTPGMLQLYDMREPKILSPWPGGISKTGTAFAVVPTGRPCFRDEAGRGVHVALRKWLIGMSSLDPADIAPELADRILTEIGPWDCRGMAFLMAGWSAREGPFLSRFSPKEKLPWKSLIHGDCGALSIGPTEIISGILDGWDGSRPNYAKTEWNAGIVLLGTCMSAACEGYRHRSIPIAGGYVDIYGILNSVEGIGTKWYYPDGSRLEPLQQSGPHGSDTR